MLSSTQIGQQQTWAVPLWLNLTTADTERSVTEMQLIYYRHSSSITAESTWLQETRVGGLFCCSKRKGQMCGICNRLRFLHGIMLVHV